MKNKTVDSYLLLYFLIPLYTLVFSLLLGPLYTGGDQIFYTKLYGELGRLDLLSAYEYYVLMVNQVELIYFSFSWVGSSLNIDKNIWFSLSNIVFSFFYVVLFKRMRVNPAITLLFFISNFYIYVIFFAADRLKFGFIFLLISAVVTTNKSRALFSILAIIGHVQMVIIYISLVFMKVPEKFKRKSFYKQYFKYLIPILIILVPMSIFIGNHILSKIMNYVDNGGVSSVLKQLVFMIFSMYCCKNWPKVFFAFVPILAVAFIIGSERITIFSFILFMFFSIKKNRGMNVPTLILISYLCFKSIFFIQRVIFTGNGFIPNS